MAVARYIIFVLFSHVLISHAWGAYELPAAKIYFHGTVTSLPCIVAPGSHNVLVDFKDVSVRDIYFNKRSTPVPFTIRLDCKEDVFNSVTVTFGGIESSVLADHLVISSVSPAGAAGVAIGLQLQNGLAIALNRPTPATRLSAGNMSLNFSAFLQGEPEALKNKNIHYGPFTSTAHYTLHYQ